MLKRQTLQMTLGPTWRGSLFYFTWWGTMGSVFPFLSVYLTRLGMSGRDIGLLVAMLPLIYLFMGPLSSALADRWSQRIQMLMLGLAGLGITLMLAWIPQSFWGVAVVILLISLFRSPVVPIADSLITGMSMRHGLNYGTMRLWGSVGFAAMAIGGGAIWEQVGFTPMFVTAGLLLGGVMIITTMLEDRPMVQEQQRQPLTKLFRDPGLVALLGGTYLVGTTLEASFFFGGVYMDSLSGSQFLIGLFLGLSAFSELPTMQYAQAIIRRLRGPGTLMLAYLLLASSYLGHAFAQTPEALLFAAVIKGFGFGLFIVGSVQLLNQRAPDEWASTVQAAFHSGTFGLSPLISLPIAGIIYDELGPVALFAVTAIMVCLGGLVVFVALLRGWLSATD